LTDLLLRIIEEFADGFIIIDDQKKVLFFNDVLLRTMGLKSADILNTEAEFIRMLGLDEKREGEWMVSITDRDGAARSLRVSKLEVEAEKGQYLLARVKAEVADRDTGGALGRQAELLFRNLGDPVMTVDLSGNILTANPSFYRLIEWEDGRNPDNVGQIYVHAAELEDKILRLTQSSNVFNLETHLYTKSRKMIRVLDSSWVLRDENGAVTGYTSHLRDITYLKNLEARLQISERNYIVLFDTILSSIIIVDPMGGILNCNYGAESLYGYKWGEIAGKEFDALFAVSRKSPSLKQTLERVNANKGRYVETDVPRKCKDGTIRFTYASYTALESSLGEVVAYSIMERDLTERVRLEKKLQDSFRLIKETQSAAILGFARLTEYRDKDTGKHLERIREYTRVLATGLARLPKYADYISKEYIEDLCLSSILHDVGKVGIEDAILRKPGKLDVQEFERIKDHTRLGGEALKAVDQEIQHESFLTIGKEVAFNHHERWDGTGYPAGKKGDQIPLSARIVALADVYDALLSKRSYKEALSHEQAVELILSERGTHFDPEIVDVFLECQETFKRIQMLESFREHPESIDDLFAKAKNGDGLPETMPGAAQ